MESNQMKKVVVVMNTIQGYDQFIELPPKYIYKDVEYCLIRTTSEIKDRDVVRIGDELKFAHDLRFTLVWDQPDLPFYDYHTKTVNLHRYNKLNQMELLARKLTKLNLKHYHPLGFSVVDFKDLKIRHHIDPGWDKYVLKPTGGARSLGVFHVEKNINFKSFITAISRLIDKGKSSNQDNPITNQDYLDVCEKFGVRLNIGRENRPNEAAKVIGENTLLIQEMNPYDDVQEFRAIVGGKDPLLVRRTHFDNPEELNVFDEVILPDNSANYFSDSLYNEIMYFLREANLLPHGSIDIWYSSKNNAWGIYEYQNQFGHVYIPEPTLSDYLKDVIANQRRIIMENTLCTL